MTLQRLKRCLYVAVALTVILIFSFSLKTGEESAQQSNWIAENMEVIIEAIEETVGIEINIRKIGHFTEFALLGAEVIGLYLLTDKRNATKLFNVFGVGLTTAVADESIQLLIPGRCGQIKDVQIDMVGYICGAALTAAVYYSVNFLRKKGKKGT